jgi:hypothetical protein
MWRMDAAKVRRFGDQSRRLVIVAVLRLTHSTSSGQAPPLLQLIGVISVIRGQFSFGAREATRLLQGFLLR